jgi:hypothetical protein
MIANDFCRVWIGTDQEMKMAGHQGPGQNIAVKSQIFAKFFQKATVVFMGKEYLLRVISTVVDMVDMSFL